MKLESINPSTNEKIQSYEPHSPEELNEILQKTHEAFLLWKKTSFIDRSHCLFEAQKILLSKKDEFAKLMTLEMGKPIAQGRAEIEKCALGCEFYAKNAEKFLAPEIIPTEAIKSYVAYEPLGIVLAVMPWNFPFWQVFRFAAPALMAGNAGVLKHAANVTGCALAIEQVFRSAGFPQHLFRSLVLDSKHVAGIIADSRVKAVTLTGSTRAGQAVASQAGAALKKSVLELGGSDPFIVLADANVDQAVELAVQARMVNSGQSCIAAKRFIVVESLKEEFENKMAAKMKTLKMGDPLQEKTEVGPLARVDLRDQLHEQVKQSLSKGAKLLCGGEVPAQRGAFYPPTVITNVKKGMPAYEEELFGPVASIIPVKDEAEAIFVANDSVFGLGATLCTQDLQRGAEIATHEIESGTCFVNAQVRSDPRLPFGGIKESGYGRELSHFGIHEFVNIKTVAIYAPKKGLVPQAQSE